MTVENTIPIIDLEGLGLDHPDEPSKDTKERIAQELDASLSTMGFVYVKNHGISLDKIEELFSASRTFFRLPLEEKEKVMRMPNQLNGYVKPNKEILHPSSKQELRESFNCISLVSNPFPDDNVPEFRKAIEALVPDLVSLSQRLLKCLSLALGMEEDFLGEKHRNVFKDPELNSTNFRTLYYPPLTGLSETELADGVVRCGQHADYATITLLMQDDLGGLEVLSNGKWIPADPIPGALLINVGKLTELLTSDRYVATVHRVRVPEEEIRRQTFRQSAALFLHPDDAAMYSPLEHFHVGKPPFKPVRAKDYLEELLFNSYKN